MKKKYIIKLKKEEEKNNQALASERVANENVIGMIKWFKIVFDKYRKRRKRFGLRFNLISAIYNMELHKWKFPKRSNELNWLADKI